MRGIITVAALLLLGCNQIAELSDEPPGCSTRDDCAAGQQCLEGACIDAPQQDDPAPELEREADALGKLAVERDMLESQLQIANEKLTEATEELADAKGTAEREVAEQNKAIATAAHKKATEALRSLAKETGK